MPTAALPKVKWIQTVPQKMLYVTRRKRIAATSVILLLKTVAIPVIQLKKSVVVTQQPRIVGM